MRVLFVDDHTSNLEGYRQTLSPFESQWDLQYAVGGRAALAALDGQDIDVVVTALDMAEVDGLAVLEHCRCQRPGAVRILVSGETQPARTAQAIDAAHQLLDRCDSPLLTAAIERACASLTLFPNPKLREVIANVDALPTTPELYSKLTTAMQDPSAGLDRIVRVLEQDPAMVAKVLKHANSPFFGLAREISDVSHAVFFLGLDMVRTLVLSEEAFRPFQTRGVRPDWLRQNQQHGMMAGHIARRIAAVDDGASSAAFLAGLLHDIGELVLASRLPDEWRAVLKEASATRRDRLEIEREHLSVTHAELGGWLLDTWNLPTPVVQAVALHHAPLDADLASQPVRAALAAADRVTRVPGSDRNRGTQDLAALVVEAAEQLRGDLAQAHSLGRR